MALLVQKLWKKMSKSALVDCPLKKTFLAAGYKTWRGSRAAKDKKNGVIVHSSNIVQLFTSFPAFPVRLTVRVIKPITITNGVIIIYNYIVCREIKKNVLIKAFSRQKLTKGTLGEVKFIISQKVDERKFIVFWNTK